MLRTVLAAACVGGSAFGALVMVVTLTGCVSPDSGRTPGDRKLSAFPGAGAPLQPYAHLTPAPWKTAPKSFLRSASGWRWARLDRSWRETVARHVVPLSREVSLVPMALTGDGGFIATVFSPGFSGVAKVEPGGVEFTKIHAFADPARDQAVGSFDGRRLVWYQYHSADDFSDFEVMSWDSLTGDVRQIGAAVAAPEGGFWPTSWRKPDARDGRATWTQGVGEKSLADVHVVDLETGRDHVVRHGQAGESFFVAGGAVVWTESPDSKTPPEFLAAAAESGRRQTTPIALRRMVGAAGLVTDGKATAFCDPTWRSVWWSPRLDVRPRRVITSPTGHFVVNSLQVVGHYLAFTVAPFTYLADTATHRYVQIGPGGWVLLDDEHLVMMMPSRQKATHGITDVVCVPLSELPPVGSAR